MEPQLHIHALRSMPLFLDAYEAAILSIRSDLVECRPCRDAADGIGTHWYGFRVRVACKKTGLTLYLHTGLIYHPDTRQGLMIEVDRKNNQAVFRLLWDNLNPQGFDTEHGEPEYLKLFMPAEKYEQLGQARLSEQVTVLGQFFQRASEAMAQVLEEEYPGFSCPMEEMNHCRELLALLNEALDTVQSPLFRIERVSDPDNLGAYALGSRYWLSVPEGDKRLYAYFGVIFSYQKDPAGIFAEVDLHSNPEWYQAVMRQMAESPGYCLSLKEPGFIKLFLPRAHQLSMNQLPRHFQLQLLKDFLFHANRAFIRGLQ